MHGRADRWHATLNSPGPSAGVSTYESGRGRGACTSAPRLPRRLKTPTDRYRPRRRRRRPARGDILDPARLSYDGGWQVRSAGRWRPPDTRRPEPCAGARPTDGETAQQRSATCCPMAAMQRRRAMACRSRELNVRPAGCARRFTDGSRHQYVKAHEIRGIATRDGRRPWHLATAASRCGPAATRPRLGAAPHPDPWAQRDRSHHPIWAAGDQRPGRIAAMIMIEDWARTSRR